MSTQTNYSMFHTQAGTEELKEPSFFFSANTRYFYFLVNYIKTRQEFILDTVQIKNSTFCKRFPSRDSP